MNDNEKKKNDSVAKTAQSDPAEEVTQAKYLRAAKAYLRNSRQKEAFGVLQQAALHYPDDPMILSYFGCLQALVDKKYRSGVETCKKAIVMLGRQESFEEDILYPVFYLNLGRAYVAAGKKKDAIDAIKKGLKYDSGHDELKKELRGLGVRKDAPVPFLDRSNPINKYVGMILRGSKKEIAKKGGKGNRAK